MAKKNVPPKLYPLRKKADTTGSITPRKIAGREGCDFSGKIWSGDAPKTAATLSVKRQVSSSKR